VSDKFLNSSANYCVGARLALDANNFSKAADAVSTTLLVSSASFRNFGLKIEAILTPNCLNPYPIAVPLFLKAVNNFSVNDIFVPKSFAACETFLNSRTKMLPILKFAITKPHFTKLPI